MSNSKKVAKTIPAADTKTIMQFNTSGKIRYLHAKGWSQGDIARALGKRPQHVNNVLRTPVKNPVNKF